MISSFICCILKQQRFVVKKESIVVLCCIWCIYNKDSLLSKDLLLDINIIDLKE